jgi:tripartite ATP-independent transporter DctP family solute receptor
MNKKSFKLIAAILSIFVLLLIAEGQSSSAPAAQPAVTISLGHPGVTTHSWQRACEYTQELLDKSGTNIKLDVFPNNQIAAGSKVIEMVQMGTLDSAGATPMTMSSFVDVMDILSLPMMFNDREENYHVIDGEVGTELDAICQQNGFKILCWWENGARDITNNTRPIVVPADLKGLSIRIPESSVFQKTFEALGVLPIAMASSEIFTALQTGVVSGQDNSMEYIWDQKYYEVQKFYSKGIMSSMLGVFMNLDKFNSLTSEQQTALLEAAQQGAIYQRRLAAENLSKLEDQLAATGIQINEIEDKDAWRTAVQLVYDEYTAKYGDMISKIQASVEQYRKTKN